MARGRTRTTTRIWTVGMTMFWMSVVWSMAPLPVDVAEDDVDRPDDRHHVGDEPPLAHDRQSLQVDERRGAEAHAVRHLAALADEVEALLAPRALDHVVHLAGGRLDVLGHLGAHLAFGQPVERLPDDAARLAHLLHAHQVTVVGVAVLAGRYVELEVVVRGVRLRAAHVVRHPGAAQHRPRRSESHGVLPREDADSPGAAQP